MTVFNFPRILIGVINDSRLSIANRPDARSCLLSGVSIQKFTQVKPDPKTHNRGTPNRVYTCHCISECNSKLRQVSSIPRADLTVPHCFATINLINVPLWNDFISPNLRPYTSPESPIDGASEEHTNTNDGKDEVRVPVGILHAIGRDEGHDGQESVGSEVEETDGKKSVPGRRPVLALLVLEVDKTSSDEAVDPRAGIGVEIDDEVVGRASGRRHEDDDGHDPVEEESGGGCIKGFDGGPETTEREKTLLAELLVKTGVCKTDRKHVTQITEGDECGESACGSTLTEDVTEEETGNNDLGVGESFFGDCGKVSDIGKDIQDGYTTDGDGCGNLEGPARVLEFTENIVGIFPSKVCQDIVIAEYICSSPFIRVNNPKERSRIRIGTPTTVPVTNTELESVVKVMWVGNLPVPS